MRWIKEACRITAQDSTDLVFDGDYTQQTLTAAHNLGLTITIIEPQNGGFDFNLIYDNFHKCPSAAAMKHSVQARALPAVGTATIYTGPKYR